MNGWWYKGDDVAEGYVHRFSDLACGGGNYHLYDTRSLGGDDDDDEEGTVDQSRRTALSASPECVRRAAR